MNGSGTQWSMTSPKTSKTSWAKNGLRNNSLNFAWREERPRREVFQMWKERAYEVRLSQSNQPSLKWPNQRGRPNRRGPWDQRPWNQTDHSPRTSKPGTWNGTRQEGQSYPGSLHDGGFLKSSDPTAWGRVICTLKCNTVYHYWSMKIPVSF